jgi:hypothetical protein
MSRSSVEGVGRSRPTYRWRVGLATSVALLGALFWTAAAGGTQPYDTYQSTVAEDGPVAQYRFDDAAGSSTLADSAGSFTATNNGSTLGGEGPFRGSKSGSFGGTVGTAHEHKGARCQT